MKENEPIEQPDVPEEPKVKKYKPEDFSYKKFNPEKKPLKGKDAPDQESEKELRRLERELDAVEDTGARAKTMKPQEVKELDRQVVVKEEDRKAPKKTQEQKERQTLLGLMRTFQVADKLPVGVLGNLHVFEFKGLQREGKEIKGVETQKLLEHVDQGGDIPKNLEFHFHTAFQRGRDENEKMDVDYKVSLQQIMRDGIETTLQTLTALSYYAANNYDAKRGRPETEKPEKTPVVAPSEQKEQAGSTELQAIKTILATKGIQASTIQGEKFQALAVAVPSQARQVLISLTAGIYTVTDKKQDAAKEAAYQAPAEVINAVEKLLE